MRISKAAVITTGAIATLAVMGATPAMAAEGATAKAGTVFGQVQQGGKHRAADEASSKGASSWMYSPEQGGGSWGGAPWNVHPQPLIGVLDDSVVNAAPWQVCGATAVAGVGGAVPLFSPNTVIGGCNNADTVLIAH